MSLEDIIAAWNTISSAISRAERQGFTITENEDEAWVLLETMANKIVTFTEGD